MPWLQTTAKAQPVWLLNQVCLACAAQCKSKCSFPLTKSGPRMYFWDCKTVGTCPLDPQTSGWGAPRTEGKPFSILFDFGQATDFRSAYYGNVPATKLLNICNEPLSPFCNSPTHCNMYVNTNLPLPKWVLQAFWVDHFHPWNISWQYGKRCSNLEKTRCYFIWNMFVFNNFKIKMRRINIMAIQSIPVLAL